MQFSSDGIAPRRPSTRPPTPITVILSVCLSHVLSTSVLWPSSGGPAAPTAGAKFRRQAVTLYSTATANSCASPARFVVTTSVKHADITGLLIADTACNRNCSLGIATKLPPYVQTVVFQIMTAAEHPDKPCSPTNRLQNDPGSKAASAGSWPSTSMYCRRVRLFDNHKYIYNCDVCTEHLSRSKLSCQQDCCAKNILTGLNWQV